MTDFHLTPRAAALRENRLNPDELITAYRMAFGIDPANVHVFAPHTGGGFGAKGFI